MVLLPWLAPLIAILIGKKVAAAACPLLNESALGLRNPPSIHIGRE
jgi:hypothetical protein